MIKIWGLFCAMQSCFALAQTIIPKSEALYPYRNKAGNFGYADEKLHIQIQPQYKSAGFFSKQGFAVVTNRKGQQGVIDREENIIIPLENDMVQLYSLQNFTLASVRKSYISKLRFWEWDFLPGLNMMGSTNDKRLFDTNVQRLRKTVYQLGANNKQIQSDQLTISGLAKDYFQIKPLADNLVLIDENLYEISPSKVRLISKYITRPLSEHTFVRQRSDHMNIVNQTGKKLAAQEYSSTDSISVTISNMPMVIQLKEDRLQPIATVYKNSNDMHYIFPDFSKPFPINIEANKVTSDITAKEILQNTMMISSVPQSDYFVVMGYHHDERFFWFLDSNGGWHRGLPADNSFTVTFPSGDIIWPNKDYFIDENKLPKRWKIHRVNQVGQRSLYTITIKKEDKTQQGIWNFDQKKWVLPPSYYQLYPLGDTEGLWRFQSEKNGLWGIINTSGKILIPPKYYSISSDGWVYLQENGNYVEYYLHLSTLKEFREK